MSTDWPGGQRFVVVQRFDNYKGRESSSVYLVWDNQLGVAVPHPRGKRRRYSMREAFSVADALNQHPAFRTQN